jgi:hypothetical protein
VKPMETKPTVLRVEVSDVALNTVVGEILRWNGSDEEPSLDGRVTIADMVADRLMDALLKDDDWKPLRKRALEIREEMIREALAPVIAAALEEGFRKTNGYGEPVGDPVTLKQVIVGEAHKMLKEHDNGIGSRSEVPFITKVVRRELEAALGKEIKDAVAAARQGVADEIGASVAAAVAEGMRKR